MRFFLDENLPYSTKKIFQEFGETWHVRDVKLQGAIDNDILKYAVSKKAILVSKDLEFANFYLYPINSHCGVVIVKVPYYYNVEQINKILKEILSTIDVENLRNSITIIEPGKIRTRNKNSSTESKRDLS